MSKVITSPVKRWQGTVTIADPLTLPQVEAFEAGLELPEEVRSKERILFTVTDKLALPGVLACVEKWSLEGFPEAVTLDNFPMSPREDTHNLIRWIFNEIKKIYNGELEIPNE